jgi:thioredoxin-like negative regulator of GroEL
MFKQVLNGVTPSYSDKINFYEVDVEEESELASMFNARSLPTVIMIRKNGTKETGVGGMDEGTLKYWLGGLIT